MPKSELPSEELMNEPGARTKLARLGCGVPQIRIAQLIGKHPSAVSRWEHGETTKQMVINRWVDLYEAQLGIRKGTILMDTCELTKKPELSFGEKIEHLISDSGLDDITKMKTRQFVAEFTEKTVNLLKDSLIS